VSLTTLMALLDAVSTLLTIVAELPAVLTEIRSLLDKMQPHVPLAPPAVQRRFAQLRARAYPTPLPPGGVT